MSNLAANAAWAEEQKEKVAWLMDQANNPEVLEYSPDSFAFNFLLSPKYSQEYSKRNSELSVTWTDDKLDDELLDKCIARL